MINRIIRISLANRALVLVLTLVVCIYGGFTALHLPIDVFPDLNRPVVTIMTEAHGLAAEEVEAQITIPIETAVNGATGVQRVRSASSSGLSIVWIEFAWESEIFAARQVVTERLQRVSALLPPGVTPALGPVSSIMGEIMLIGLSGNASPLELRTLADWTIRPRLLAIPGVSQVSVIGGDKREFHVAIDPEDLFSHRLTLEDVRRSIADGNRNTTGGVWVEGYREVLIRTLGRIRSIDDLKHTVIVREDGRSRAPLLLGELAEISERGPINKRGDAGINARPGVILSIQKQPQSDTAVLTAQIDRELEALADSLPEGVWLQDDIFRQNDFISRSISNVLHALRDGSILVAIILFLFLLNFRTTAITLTAIPLSIIVTVIVFQAFGLSINTMTLGGLAIAIGELVDDAIVDVENVFRRLRENARLPKPLPALEVIYTASTEVRNSIVIATVVVVLVFLPLFALSGIEGRIFSPLGIAYVTAILASLGIAVTVTPVLCYFLLPSLRAVREGTEGRFVTWLKGFHAQALDLVFRFERAALASIMVLFLLSLALFLSFGREFLPPFNEGSLTLTITMPPGTSIHESNRIGTAIEHALLTIPEIEHTGRRTGRAELDEHVEGVNSSDIEAEIHPSERSQAEVLEHIRELLSGIPGIALNIGQPISHRIDHLLTGVRAQLVLKVYGSDLTVLRELAREIRAVAEDVDGIVDLQIEQQVLVPQAHITMKRDALAGFGVSSGALAEYMETALSGAPVTQLLDGQQRYDVVLRLTDEARSDRSRLLMLPVPAEGGGTVPLAALVSIEDAKGPNTIVRENASRRIAVFGNVAGRDLGSAVAELRDKIHTGVKLPHGYFVRFEGQFESQESASKRLWLLGIASLIGIFTVLYAHFKRVSYSLQIMLSVPFAFIGGFLAVYVTGQAFSIASLVGLITLTGIATRNGIMMIDHFLHLVRHEGEEFDLNMIYRGARERLVPVMMTALTAMLALVPILLTPGEPGREILFPVAAVIFGGLCTGTVLNLLVTPVVFWRLEQSRGGAATLPERS